jgi:hypothetical protein
MTRFANFSILPMINSVISNPTSDEFTIRFKKMVSDSKPLKQEKNEKNPDEDIRYLIKYLEATLK